MQEVVPTEEKMAKLKSFLLFLLLALAAAGIFGAVHDQISYTVSQEYYTRFKFPQFGLLDESIPERLRAAQVGFLASWWMGIPLGLFSGVAAFIHQTPAQMRRALHWSLALITGVTLAFSLCGLLYGYLQTANINLSAYQGWYIPSDLKQPRNFLCAGYMHNSAYLGGVFAIPVAWLFHIGFKRRSAPGAHPLRSGSANRSEA
jgi:hypothetical protein